MIRRLSRWARSHTREGRYSPVGWGFHWLIAALVLFQLWWGWRTGRLPVGPEKLDAYAVHAQIGLALMVLTLLRMAWRAAVPGPVNDADKPGWQSTAAHLTHYVFYLCLVLLPLSGWAMWSATAQQQPLSLPGGLPWPMLPFGDLAEATRWRIELWAERVHGWLIVALLVMIPAHVGAALKHHFWNRDDVLAGMLPLVEAPDPEGPPHSGPGR